MKEQLVGGLSQLSLLVASATPAVAESLSGEFSVSGILQDASVNIILFLIVKWLLDDRKERENDRKEEVSSLKTEITRLNGVLLNYVKN